MLIRIRKLIQKISIQEMRNKNNYPYMKYKEQKYERERQCYSSVAGGGH